MQRCLSLCLAAGFIAGASTCAIAAGPFTVDAGSYVEAVAWGTNNQLLYMGFNSNPGTWTAFVGASTHTTLTASALTIRIQDLYTSYWSGGPRAVAQINADLYFTPTVPNLSYSFDGFANAVQLGSPTLVQAASTIHLAQNVGLGVIHYRNAVSYRGPCVLWDPTTPQLGTQSGDLMMGMQYVMNCRLTVALTHGGDVASDFRVSTGALPFVRLQFIQRPCDGDMDGDGFVGDSDFAVFALGYDLFDCADPAMLPGCPADLNGDGFVDDSDFVVFAAAYDALLCP